MKTNNASRADSPWFDRLAAVGRHRPTWATVVLGVCFCLVECLAGCSNATDEPLDLPEPNASPKAAADKETNEHKAQKSPSAEAFHKPPVFEVKSATVDGTPIEKFPFPVQRGSAFTVELVLEIEPQRFLDRPHAILSLEKVLPDGRLALYGDSLAKPYKVDGKLHYYRIDYPVQIDLQAGETYQFVVSMFGARRMLIKELKPAG